MNAVRLQPMRLPQALHGAQADADGFGHGAAGPMRGVARRFGAGQALGDDPGQKWSAAGLARLVAQQTIEALLGVSRLRKNPGNGQPLAVKAILERSLARAGRLAPILRELEAEGIVSANAKARALNERQVLTPRGGKWTARSVINVRNRLEAS